MPIHKPARRRYGLVGRLLLLAVLFCAVVSCSDDAPTAGGGDDPFKEGLRFTLVVNGAWSADTADTRERTQGELRVSVAGHSQIWLGSDAMTQIGFAADDERYQTVVRFGDLEPGSVVLRILFQQTDAVTGHVTTVMLKEVATIGGNPIEIKEDEVTDLGTVEVTIP